jgi:hypothetical protein
LTASDRQLWAVLAAGKRIRNESGRFPSAVDGPRRCTPYLCRSRSPAISIKRSVQVMGVVSPVSAA